MTSKQTQAKKDYDLEHMPHFIKNAPWYMNQGQDNGEKAALFHQRIEDDKKKQQEINNWYKKGIAGSAATKFRKGACTNCGAMTHKVKECVERPRKVGAKYTSRDIGRDERDLSKQGIKLNYEGKRDRWNGYDNDLYKEQVIDEWHMIDEIEKEKRAALKAKNGGSSDSEDEEKGTSGGATFASADPKVKSMQKNLRIREDTAKYLRNLNPNSAPYDPKSRSMKENPNPDLAPEDQQFKGDNFVKMTGDYVNLIQSEGFMLQANKRAQELGGSLQANTVGMPSQFNLLQKEYKRKKELLTSSKMQNMQEKYGNQESHINVPYEMQEQIQDDLDQQQIQIVEQQIKQQREKMENVEKVKQVEAVGEAEVRVRGLTGAIRSKYESIADLDNGGHSAVWGSFWHKKFGWGYKCCMSFKKYEPDQDRCKGDAGRKESLKQQIEWERAQDEKARMNMKRDSSPTEQHQSQEKRQRHDSDSD